MARKRMVLTQSSSSLSLLPIFGSLWLSASAIAALASAAPPVCSSMRPPMCGDPESPAGADYIQRVGRAEVRCIAMTGQQKNDDRKRADLERRGILRRGRGRIRAEIIDT